MYSPEETSPFYLLTRYRLNLYSKYPPKIINMGSFEYRDAVSVIQIAVFPIFLWLGLKFKNEQKPGWFGIGFLSLCRIIGGSCMLALISRNTRGLWAAVLVCEAIGFLLLVFLLLELLEKMLGLPTSICFFRSLIKPLETTQRTSFTRRSFSSHN